MTHKVKTIKVYRPVVRKPEGNNALNIYLYVMGNIKMNLQT